MTDFRLRVAVLLVTWCATASLVISHLISLAIGLELGGLLLLATLIANAQVARTPRTLAGAVLFALISAAAAATNGFGQGSAAALALIAVSLLVAQLLWADSVRELVVAAALGLSLLVMALGLAPAVALAGPLLLGWPALLVVAVLARRSANSEGWTAAVVVGRAYHRSPLVSVAIGSVVCLLTAVLVLLLAPSPDPAAAARFRNLTGLSSGDSPASGRALASYSGDDLDLRVRGELPNTEVAAIPAQAPALWRVAIMGTYDGSGWTSGPTPRPVAVAPVGTSNQSFAVRNYLPDASAALGDTGSAGAEISRATGSGLSYRVQRLVGAPETVLAPLGLETITINQGGVFALGAGRLILSTPPPSSYSIQVRVESPPGDAQAPLTAANPAERQWTTLPNSITVRTRTLAQQLAGQSRNRTEAAQKISAYLQRSYPYDLNSAVPPRGSDAVDHFLFTAKTGFCEQFASAAVILLRTLGIPARIATGFAAPQADASGNRIIRGVNAHAWVEVYDSQVGWTSWDPTPSASSAKARWSLSTWGRQLLNDADRRYRAAATLGLGVLLSLAALRLWRHRRRPRLSAVAPAPTRAWLLVQAITGLRQAVGPPAANASISTLAAMAPHLGADMVAVTHRALYDRSPPPAAQVDAAALAFHRATVAVRAESSVGPAAAREGC